MEGQVTRSMLRGALFGFAILVFGSACATPYDPFLIPAAELRSRVRTIALAPLRVSASVAEREFAREQIEPMVSARLSAGGFQVIASAEMEKLWRSAAGDVGDLFDPVTGRIDQERYDAVEASVYHELRAQHDADAVLWLRIDTVELYLATRNATFCGTTDAVYWPGGQLGTLEQATLVIASCLYTNLYDMEERELYGIRSGLETIETFARQTRAERPLGERLKDRGRLREAVEATLGPLADQSAGR